MTLGQHLLHPRSVAIVGASDDESKTTARPLQYLRKSGFAGTIYPINPNRDMVLGERAWRSLVDLPTVPDHAFLLVPTEAVQAAVTECVALNIPLVTILAGGYGEHGAEGMARAAALTGLVSGSKTRILGPNSIGLVNVRTGLTLTANAAFAEDGIPAGGLFIASHSGSMIGALLSRGKSRGIGFAGFASLGAELDLSLGELCSATIEDPGITHYALFLESIQHGEDIHRFAYAAAQKGKPVIAYKLGRSDQAAELAQSHTGAIAGDDFVADAFLREIGIARVETLEGLIEGSALLGRGDVASWARSAPRVAIVTTTGGGAAMVVDQLAIRGVEVAIPSVDTIRRLEERGISASESRILDLTLAGTRKEVMGAALDVLLTSEEFDLVVAIAGSSARFQPQLLVPAITEAAAAHAGKSLVAFVAPEAPEALRLLAEGGVPAFRTPEACADAIAAHLGRRPAKPFVCAPNIGALRQLDEAEGYQRLRALGIPAADHAIVSGQALTSPIAYPVALKLLSATNLHKSDIGGVRLGIASDEEFRGALADIRARVSAAHPDQACEDFLVQAMQAADGEVLLSFFRDPEAGPMIMLSSGGLLAEIHKDRTLRMAPVAKAEARAMIGEVHSLRALEGFRGKPPSDMEALADAIVALSRAGPDIREAEINPLLIGRQGVVAVDAVVTIRDRRGG